MTPSPPNHKAMPEEIWAYLMPDDRQTFWFSTEQQSNVAKLAFDLYQPQKYTRADLQAERIKRLEEALQRANNYVTHAHQLIGDYTGDDRDVINAHGLLDNARAVLDEGGK